MPAVKFNRYYRYEELTALLRAYEAEFPDLVKVVSIGDSHEGRTIWLAEVTSLKTGPAAEKPGFWADGNIHASEVSASTAVLHLLHKLCTKYGEDEKITRALDTRAFYLCPRLNPDGAEWALEEPPRVIRSSTRKWPHVEEDLAGLERQDIDGDGRILTIRMKDSNGPWKISSLDERLLERRKPDDFGGTYYRLLPEGLFHNFDGMTMKGRRMPEGLDINRNYPSGWRSANEQPGAGDYPTSEPEVRAMVQAIVDRPNICGGVCFHTFSGVNLRPSSSKPDDQLPAEDVWTFKAIGDAGKEITGYEGVSVYHDFKYHPKEYISGTQDDWLYEQRGIYAWTTEIWSPQRQAGITGYKYTEWFREHPHEDEVKLLEWSDAKLDGKGYVDWHPFDHPQLGPVEIGGWDSHYAFRNPPPQYLEAEVAPLGDWVVWQALASPKLELREVRVEGGRIRLAVQNTGWLPTQVTQHALEKKLVRGVFAEIEREGSAPGGIGADAPSWLVSGQLRQEVGQLKGRNLVPASGFGWHLDDTSDVAIFEWVVQPGTYQLTAKHDRAGLVRASVNVE